MDIKGLRTIRKARKLTLEQLSAASGIPASTLGNYETGRIRLGPERVAILADVLEVPASVLTPTPTLVPVRRTETAAMRHLISKTLARRPIAYAELLGDLLRTMSREELQRNLEQARTEGNYTLMSVLAAELGARGEEPEEEPDNKPDDKPKKG